MSDFQIQQGTDAGVAWPITNQAGVAINLTGWTGVCQFRAVGTNRLLATLSTANGKMILGNGSLTLVWTAAETSAWKWKQAIFDIELTNPSSKTLRVMQGLVKLSKEVSV
jgi:hypothetical protein